MAFYEKFEELCKIKNITPTRAARENGIAQSVVSMWKTRGSTPQAATVQKLAKYFGVTVDYLLGKEEKTPAAQNGSEHFKPKLRSISRLEDSEITPEQDEEISNYIDYLLSKRGKE